ncbi:MAG: 1-acyl-sn-glycerol-3-phosphate acyltransferase [Bacteroidetes bacterium]|nr:1-acyl-sn-glycerol-3-phosphate acyltransferase [Bacteroidota bacterium]
MVCFHKRCEKPPSAFSSVIDKIGNIRFERQYALIAVLVLLCIASLFLYRKAGFETDMNTMNYMEPRLRLAGNKLDSLSNGKLKNIYIVATGSSRENALRLNERLQSRIDILIRNSNVAGVSGVRTLLLSDSLSSLRLNKWEMAFPPEKLQKIIADLEQSAAKTGFTPGAFKEFREMISKSHQPLNSRLKSRFESALFSEWLNQSQGIYMVSCIARVKPMDVGKIYSEFSSIPGVVIFDRQKLTDRFVEGVRRDFDRLVMLSMLFVSLLLWFSFGRIELAFFTAIPMYLSWLITLGFMGATGIKFNIFNIIVSSFIFGLGVDYSILMMRGLLKDYTFRSQNISSYRISILLSSATTLFGVAALFTASHPALNSIALVSVVGIVILVLITLCIQPLVAGWFIAGRLSKNTFPITARILVKTFITWGNIVLIALILTVTGSLMYFLLPIKRRWKENSFHAMFCGLSKLYIFLTFSNRRLYNPYGEDFRKPALIISNHQSLIETPAMLRFYPKIIILTNTWVYYSPVFGPIARLASFYNVDKGLDYVMEKLKKKVDEGYSILIFPEAHRSIDHHIQRFHRGAFYIAEQLHLDILPVMMFGTGDFLPRGAFWGRPNIFRQRIYPRIKPGDVSFGTSYQERARMIRRWYVTEYERFRAEEANTMYYRRKLILNYVFKGPILEWYLRIKLRLEKNYSLLDEYVPRQGEILDMGCGYGFASQMLHLTAPERIITGVDYDSEKINVAKNGFLNSSGLNFLTADIRLFEFSPKDCIILGDVLHYIPPDDQEKLLIKCMQNLREDGIIIIRDADEANIKGHSRSKLTEFFSTGMRFNKTYDESFRLHFFSTPEISKLALRYGYSIRIIESKTYSSNTCYLLKKSPKSKPVNESL